MERCGVELTNLDQPLFDGSRSTKLDLVEYLDAVHERILPHLRDRPLSVIRVRPGQPPFMQKNLPKYAPDWVQTVKIWAEASHREVTYALCNDRRTLLWFANQRAVEFHPALMRGMHQSHMVLDLDPPEGGGFQLAVRAAHLVRQVLVERGLASQVKTSGAKGVHILVPVVLEVRIEDLAAATRAVAARAERIDPALATTAFIKADRGGRVFLDSTRAGGATIVSAYSPRIRPGTPVSFPLSWDDLDDVAPSDFTIHNVAGKGDAWQIPPDPQTVPADLIEEGHTIPVARVPAMQEGRRRARARRSS